jgi:type I restriction enzyme R subunit
VNNQNPEQKARDNIDKMLETAGWVVQDKDKIDWSNHKGIAIREYSTDTGPADYVLFINIDAAKFPIGIIEAKPEDEGQRISTHEEQVLRYAESKLKYCIATEPIPFLYISTSIRTLFFNLKDPKPRSREIFNFHRPETLIEWSQDEGTLRSRLENLPLLQTEGLRDCQIKAINNLEKSFKQAKPKALIQMATGSGKTFTAITFIYRLLKYAKAKRILFLVDTKNLGEQAEQEIKNYIPPDDNRTFSELYTVQRLKNSYIPQDTKVCISTIQRMYSILKGEALEESAEDQNPNEYEFISQEKIKEVIYNSNAPIEMFDFIIIDECHRSIYNLWKQVLDYYDAFLIGLTATPDKRTFAFFNENVVSEYTHEEAVADGVNVGYDIYVIETEITKQGSKIKAKEYIEKRDKLSRKKRWEQQDEDLEYSSKQLDKDIVNPSQIRNIIKAFRDKLSEIFPNRKQSNDQIEVPKTLVFAKTDSHADDIISIIREEFGERNDFCKKITYKSKEDPSEDPKSILASFRNSYNPRIAVTVDMIATGTDVKPIECLLFMRDVKSRNYFEQMKGRGTRTLAADDLKRITPSAKTGKTHFVIVDAVGVTKSVKTDSRSLERKKTVPLKDLMYSILMGSKDEDVFLSVASRLSRLNNEISPQEKQKFQEITKGKSLNTVIHELLNAFDADEIEIKARESFQIDSLSEPSEEQKSKAQLELIRIASSSFTGNLNTYIENVRKEYEQTIGVVNIDKLEFAGWDSQAKAKAENHINEFKDFLEKHKDEIIALRIFYNEPYRLKDLTYKMIGELYEVLQREKPHLAPLYVYEAFERFEENKSNKPENQLTALVSLIRKVCGIDKTLTAFDDVVNRNFKSWIFKKQAGSLKFNEEQMDWLRMIKSHITSSFHIDKDDFEYAPFDAQGGLGKMHKLFGLDADSVISEMNEVLVA